MTHLYRVDGFLFWVVNFWHLANNVPLDESDTYLEWGSTIDTHEHAAFAMRGTDLFADALAD